MANKKTLTVRWPKAFRGRYAGEVRSEPDCPQIHALEAQGFCEIVKPEKSKKEK